MDENTTETKDLPHIDEADQKLIIKIDNKMTEIRKQDYDFDRYFQAVTENLDQLVTQQPELLSEIDISFKEAIDQLVSELESLPESETDKARELIIDKAEDLKADHIQEIYEANQDNPIVVKYLENMEAAMTLLAIKYAKVQD